MKNIMKSSIYCMQFGSQVHYCNFYGNTDAVHPADVGRDAGEDGGLLVGVAAVGGHKAGHTVDNPFAVDTAVQGATRVTLEKPHHRQTSESKIHNLLAELGASSPFSQCT